ncbi:hypothetical protein A4X17_11385 [Plantibacter sp. H53]|uniref:GIY-YIG nuclease family protein n=1 Tax=Plantibacter sp. H53 TaxID=1827323 RepID=UPI0007D9B8C3|nr:GIY-YIG nuclease family protein [Plantibacter sp. H53]OAN35077.1 hypothetical protein A4X17_11385 [Plantibacter sp. H53]
MAKSDAGVETFVYRAFSSSGSLLYVGIASDWKRRLKQHSKYSRWYRDAGTVRVEVYSTRAEAFAAESWAITYEFPEWNGDSQWKHCPFIPPVAIETLEHAVVHDIWSND